MTSNSVLETKDVLEDSTSDSLVRLYGYGSHLYSVFFGSP